MASTISIVLVIVQLSIVLVHAVALDELSNSEVEKLLEFKELKEIEATLLRRSSEVDGWLNQPNRREVIARRPTPKLLSEGEHINDKMTEDTQQGIVVPKRQTPKLPFDPNRIVVGNNLPPEMNHVILRETPKPPEKIEKPALPPTPAGPVLIIRTTPQNKIPDSNGGPEEHRILPQTNGPVLRPTPPYKWTGEKYEHVFPANEPKEALFQRYIVGRDRRYKDNTDGTNLRKEKVHRVHQDRFSANEDTIK